MSDPFVVIGGDAAGMSAASKARREAPDREIIVFEKGAWVSYGACGLPYYVKGEIDSLEDLVSIPPQQFREERNIDLRTEHTVTAINPDHSTVTVEHNGDTFEQVYGDLLIATGASAIVPPIDGVDLSTVETLHSMESGRSLRERIESPDGPRSVGIVGGGYIGIEMAEAFVGQGLDVELFEMEEQVLSPFGHAVGTAIAEEMERHDVALHLDTSVTRLSKSAETTILHTDNGQTEVDFVLLGVGVTPNVALAREADIAIGATGAIATDEYGETSHENIFAAGDCTEVTNAVTGMPDYVPLALTANRAGRAIGQTVTGTPTTIGPILGSAALKAFDLEAARTGLLEETRAREVGFDPVAKTITARSRAGYYPGGSPLTVTLVADRQSGRVLGSSIVGKEGAVKRIDTVATAIHAELTVDELTKLDLTYAPPFGPTWDPVLTAGKVLGGVINS